MIRLTMALKAWGTSEFETILKQEIAQLDIDQLPLQQGLSSSNYVTDDPITVIINRITEKKNVISIAVGIMYIGVTGGCSCSDDPTPDSDNNEYCEVLLDIDKITGITDVALATE